MTTTTRMERLVLGGGDAEIAAMRVEARQAVQGFSTTSRVGLAADKVTAQYAKAVGFTGTSNLASLWGTYTDIVPSTWYTKWKDRFVTSQGGDL